MRGWGNVPRQEHLRIQVEEAGAVSALLDWPAEPQRMLVLAHGAGAGMTHPFMAKLSAELGAYGFATLRYQFPYMEARRRRPDAPGLLIATVEAAVQTASKTAAGLSLFAGGKSMGGRMTSQAASQGKLERVKGLVFYGFPLHPPKQPGTSRADHLVKVRQPMLFLQGTRDSLADLTLLCPICDKLGARATLHIVEGADHSFHMLKSSGQSDSEVMQQLAETTASWAGRVVTKP